MEVGTEVWNPNKWTVAKAESFLEQFRRNTNRIRMERCTEGENFFNAPYDDPNQYPFRQRQTSHFRSSLQECPNRDLVYQTHEHLHHSQ
jgi:TFIIF-interacting CTD phosphatase-like protein